MRFSSSKVLHRNGFSLIEIAIVLVIIGILTASVTAGRYLIKQAELKSIMQQVVDYRTSVHNFRGKYYSWPGDMPNATSFWGTGVAGICPDNLCNGNGDDRIIGNSGGPNQNEGFRAWQHLALSDMIRGSYDGIGRGGSNQAVIGENVPKSPRDEGGFSLHYWGLATDRNNAIGYGAFQEGEMNIAPVLSTEDAVLIDRKLDDGSPRSGAIWAAGDGGSGNCYTASNYNLQEGSIQCMLLFWIDAD